MLRILCFIELNMFVSDNRLDLKTLTIIYLQRCSNNAKEASAHFPSKHNVIISVDVLVGSQMELYLSIKFNLLNKDTRYILAGNQIQ